MVAKKSNDRPVEALLYKPRPLLGFDIGHGSMKVLQLRNRHNKCMVEGYGYCTFDSNAVQDGVIVDIEKLAAAAQALFSENIVGSFSTRSVAACMPVTNTYSRVLTLPKLERTELMEAVKLESEQYIPMPIDSMYLDYQIIDETPESYDLLVSAAPRRVVDSYVLFFRTIGLEASVLEPSIIAVTRLVRHTERTDVPTLVVDFGSVTTDLIIYDSSIRVTGTINFGGNTLTNAISAALGVSEKQAHLIKTKYGLEKSKKQVDILNAVTPPLNQLVAEIKKMIRYYEDRNTGAQVNNTVSQIILLGGGANLPGFSTFITDHVRIATRLSNTWKNIHFGDLQGPHQIENTMYATASGLGLITPREVLK